MDHILKGDKVPDFTHFLAGSTATRIMAEMAAELEINGITKQIWRVEKWDI